MICSQQVIQPSASKQASHITLPHIGSPVAGQKSMFSIEKYPVVIHEPTAIRTARRVGVLCFLVLDILISGSHGCIHGTTG